MFGFLKRVSHKTSEKQVGACPERLIGKLIYAPGKFSFVKAVDVAIKSCDVNFVSIKSNINYSSKYTDVSVIEGLKDGIAEIYVNVSGISGIDGILPDCYTEEYITHNSEHKKAVVDFLDIFNERILMLRYRYLKRQNVETLSVPIEKSLIGNIIYSLSGFGFDEDHERVVPNIIPEQFKISVQNLLWRYTRSASGLKAILESFFKVPVEIRQFEGGFVQVNPGEQTSIGKRGNYNKLGQNSFLGDTVWDATQGITILIGALDFKQYAKFLPKQSHLDQKFSPLQKMKEIIRLYVPHGIKVNLRFFLDKCAVKGTALNGTERLNKDSFIFGVHGSKSAFFEEKV